MHLCVEKEALCIRYVDGRLIARWPYYNILCWGFTQSTFMWRAFARPTDTCGGPAPATAAQAAIGGPELESLLRGITDTALTDSALECRSVRVHRDGDGALIERRVMDTVLALMQQMDARGVGEAELVALLDTLRHIGSSGGEAATEMAMAALRQVALTRSFDAKQAATVLRCMEDISPFDKVEAAVVLAGALLTPSSLPMLLQQCFADEDERSNVALRVGCRLRADGGVEALYPGDQRAATTTARG